MEAHEPLIGEGLDPREPIGVGPDGIVDSGEVDLEAAAAL